MNNKFSSWACGSSADSATLKQLPVLALIATATAGLLYFCFFLLAPWIWNHDIPVSQEELLPWVYRWLLDEKQRDGIELYALYLTMFLNLIMAFATNRIWCSLAQKPARHYLAVPLAALSLAFLFMAGFHPPMSDMTFQSMGGIAIRSLGILAALLPTCAALYYLQEHRPGWLIPALSGLLLPVCFISTRALAWQDAQYIFAPALRLLHGAALPEIYFQYDLLPSLAALAWMKLGLDLNWFQAIAQLSYFLLFLAIYYFSSRWFADKRLPILLLISLALIRIYAGPNDAVYLFQVTPIRLDMWIILLLLVYFKGAHHWSAGLFCGLMLLLHKNFGIIYSAAYIQLILTLCMLDISTLPASPVRKFTAITQDFFRKNLTNLSLILAGALLHFLLFRNPAGQTGYDYQGLGIGFMKISSTSFYWYAVALSGLSFLLLLRLRTRLPDGYFTTGLCLIYLMIGNSLYFFGRSHENNIINISAILVLLLFLMLDLLGHLQHGKSTPPITRCSIPVIASVLFIASITIWYGNNITTKLSIQAHNAAQGQLIYPADAMKYDISTMLAEVRQATENSPNVYFVNYYDFLLEYYGGYAPVGYYNPLTSWIFRGEFDKFLQGLVNSGYYLVIDEKLMSAVKLAPATYHYKRAGNSLVIWKM